MKHSINVSKRVYALAKEEAQRDRQRTGYRMETLAVVGFLHDLCKIDAYGTESGESEWDENAIQDWLSEKYCDMCEHGGWADDDCECATVNCPHIREHFGETEGGGNEILHKAAEQEAE